MNLYDRIPIRETSYSQFASAAQLSLECVERLGLDWRGTRFGVYLELLTEAATRSYPRRIDWAADRDALVNELEAIGQVVQLVCAVALVRSVDTSQLRDRLGRVLSGKVQPVSDDGPRNILLELTTALLLQGLGFKVELTRNEDVLLHVPSCPPIPVECKRPFSGDTVEKNVKKVRHQLRAAQGRYPHGGIAVIGLDRVLGVSGQFATLRLHDDLPARVTSALSEGALNIWRLGGGKLAASALSVITVLAGAVYSQVPPRPTSILRMALLPLPVDTPRLGIRDSVTSTFKPGLGPPLEVLMGTLRQVLHDDSTAW